MKNNSRFWRAEDWKDDFERHGLIIRFIRYGVLWLNMGYNYYIGVLEIVGSFQ